MKSFRIPSLWRLIACVALLVAIAACSNSTSNNYPTGGGGGGTTAELNSGNLSTGAGYQHTFATAGTFGYHCTIHGAAAMSGSVTVASAGADSVVVTIGPGTSYAPTTVTIKPTGYVRWINTGSPHTVTSN